MPLQVRVQDLRCGREEDYGGVCLERCKVREQLGIFGERGIVAQRAERILRYGDAVVAVSLQTRRDSSALRQGKARA